MITSFERLLSFRYLRARRREGFISVIAAFSFLGIALGVATLIVVMAVMNGFREELINRILGMNAHISVMSYQEPIPDYEHRIVEIAGLGNVTTVTPIIQEQALATANGEHSGVVVRGIRKSDLMQKTMITTHMVAGSLAEFGEPAGVILGSRLAQQLRVVPGDVIRLISPKNMTNTFVGALPRMKDYRVVGLFEIGMIEYDNSTLFMTLSDAQRYFALPEHTVNMLEVMLTNPGDAPATVQAIVQKTDIPYHVVDWMQLNAQFINSLKVERNVMFLILTLIILVAAFNIISGMIMLVNDKGQDIAILRTMGASKGSILRIFMTTGAVIGIVGTFLGVGLGLGFALNIEAIRHWLESITGTNLFAEEVYFLSQLPARVELDDVIGVIAMALGLSFLATLYPAWRAANIDPAEGLRYE